MADFPPFAFTTQETWYGELSFKSAEDKSPLPLTGRIFEMWITPASSGNQIVPPELVLTMETGGGLSLKAGDDSTIVFRVPKDTANNFKVRGQYTADILEVTNGDRYLFMPVRIDYYEPSALRSFLSRFLGVGVNFASRQQPIYTPLAVPGREGKPGATILRGTVPPVPSDGKDGDYYIEDRTASGQGRRMWGPRTGGAWPGTPWTIQVAQYTDIPGLAGVIDDTRTQPVGVAVSRPAYLKWREFVSVMDHRRPDDPDDTAAFQRMFAAGTSRCLVPARQYIVDTWAPPSAVKEIIGLGRPLIIPPPNKWVATSYFRNEWSPFASYEVGQAVNFIFTADLIGAGLTPDGQVYRCIKASQGNAPGNAEFWQLMPYESWLPLYNLSEGGIEGIDFYVDPHKYPNIRVLDLSVTKGFTAAKIGVLGAGAIGLYAGNAERLKIEDPKVRDFTWHGIFAEGAAQDNIRVTDGSVKTIEIGVGHGVGFSDGQDCQAISVLIEGPRTFGVALASSNSKAMFCRIKNSKREGVCIYRENNEASHNIISYDEGVSHDYGLTFDGNEFLVKNARACFNTIIGAGSAAVCVSSPASGALGVDGFEILHNTAKNCNSMGVENSGGVQISGALSRNGKVGHNIVTDERATKLHGYGIIEVDLGNGMPNNNEIYDNDINGYIHEDIRRGGNTTKVWDRDFVEYPVTVYPLVGSIQGAGGVAKRKRAGSECEVIIEMVIGQGANDGSAAMSFSTPFPATGRFATGIGWEAISNRPLTVRFGGPTPVITFSDTRDPAQQFPGASGSVLYARLHYEMA